MAGSASPVTPSLLVTIDTEEEGLWSNIYRSTGNTVQNLRGIPRFQELCDEFGVRPTYLIDTPVVEDDFGAELLAGYQAAGRAEVGAHLHPWCAPPFDEELTQRNSFLCNLPEPLQRAKLDGLTQRIRDRCGRAPTSFRAGRYGFGPAAAGILRDLGYVVDSSVLPFSEPGRGGGPDYTHAPWRRYWISGTDILAPSTNRELLELPVGVGFSGHDFEAQWARRLSLSRSPWRRLRLVGLLERLGIGRRIKLSPEQATAREMLTLIRYALAEGSDCLVLMFHSSSLMAGGSPYVPDAAALDEFLRRLRDVFEHWVSQQGLPAPTMTEFASKCSAE